MGAALALGFRPFFLLASIFAATVMPVWLLVFFGVLTLPTPIAPSAWHGHEMIYGVVVPVIAGFLLTAVRNWTGLPTPSGPWLASLVLVWLVGRVGILASALLPWGIGAIADVLFVPALGLAIARPLIRAKNWRNIGLLVPLALLVGANAWFHFGPAGAAPRALRLALDSILVLVVIIGGRVIPSFTENALHVSVVRRAWLDWTALALVAIVAVVDVLPSATPWAGAAAVGAGVANAARVLGWRSRATLAEPILWVLHLAYAWMAIGLILSGVAAWMSWPSSAPLHALTVGAIGLVVLGMTSRVSLGHTGRLLRVPRAIVVAYGSLAAAAVVRALGPLWFPDMYRAEIVISGLLWTAAFGLFAITYLPILTAPRVDGKPG